MSLHIRPATASDSKLILRFITELARYENAEHEVKASVADIERDLSNETPQQRPWYACRVTNRWDSRCTFSAIPLG